MPSGAKKRKAAKKKKVHNSSTTNSHQGENDGGELSSPTSQDPSIVVENRDDDSSENKSKDANGEEGNIEIESGSKTKSSNGSSSSSSDSSDEDSHLEKKEVVLEPPVPETESLPEKITRKDEELEVSPIDEVSKVYDETKNEERQESVPQIESLPEETPHKAEEVESSTIVDSPLQEVPKVYDETKNEEKERKELVVGETQTPEVVEEHKAVVSEISSKDDYPNSSVIESVSKDNGFIESPREQLELSTPPKDPISQVHVGDHANETDTVEHSDRQTEVSSPPIVEHKRTSWMNCCGIFELFSGSGR